MPPLFFIARRDVCGRAVLSSSPLWLPLAVELVHAKSSFQLVP